MTSKRKSSLKYTKEDKIKHLICSDNESNQIETDESTHKRRKSSRKSVAFTGNILVLNIIIYLITNYILLYNI